MALVKKEKKLIFMAQDSSGRKYNRIPGYTRIVEGKPVQVKPHVRSNRTDSKGKK
uniref:hypothetical protein n=1 Tax=Chryseobacterium sp. TaxID=1871047 RepID=UPI0015EFCEC5|nr:hypothetical protein [Chryseobacterium sp.]